ncbi:hypothetical protein HA402_009717 [Bradysia odoriphaga]|nr:hypothetical protein HA402_009717 [Bradysia odoriphaga]
MKEKKLRPNTKQTSASATAVTPVPLSHPGELEELQSILHFPEEVALRLTDAEYQLFYQVPPVDYFKHVILELQNESGTLLVQNKSTIRALQKRFDEVCSWVTHFIISQPTHDERKAAFSCLLRAALTCWNIGNFNGAMEITTGLRSIQLKSLLTTFTDKGKIPVLEFLSAALESAEYERALGRGLAMPECRVVPCYKMFLKELKDIVSNCPLNISRSSPDVDVEHITIANRHSSHNTFEAINRGVQTSGRLDTKRESPILPSRAFNRQVYISDYNGDGDLNFTKFESLGLLNDDQMYKIQAVMDHIDLCHQHHHCLSRESSTSLLDYLRTASLGPRQLAAASTYHPELEELEEDYEVEIGNYNPVQPLLHDHAVCMIPISSPHHKVDHHILQILHHGTTAIICEPDTSPNPSCYVYFRLERSCAMVTWHRSSWRKLKTNQEYNLAINPEELVSQRIRFRQPVNPGETEAQNTILDDGCLDLTIVKEITIGSRHPEHDSELLITGKRFGLSHLECCCIILASADSAISCTSCGDECADACGTRHFRTCCFNYLRKRSSPPVMDPKPKLWLSKSLLNELIKLAQLEESDKILIPQPLQNYNKFSESPPDDEGQV